MILKLSDISYSPQTYYAVKVIKSAKPYRIAGRDEVKILQHIKNQGREGADGYNRIISYYSCFNEYSITGKHKCMVFDMMGPSLLDLLMKSEFRGIYEQSAKIIVKQVCIINKHISYN